MKPLLSMLPITHVAVGMQYVWRFFLCFLLIITLFFPFPLLSFDVIYKNTYHGDKQQYQYHFKRVYQTKLSCASRQREPTNVGKQVTETEEKNAISQRKEKETKKKNRSSNNNNNIKKNNKSCLIFIS